MSIERIISTDSKEYICHSDGWYEIPTLVRVTPDAQEILSWVEGKFQEIESLQEDLNYYKEEIRALRNFVQVIDAKREQLDL